MEKISLILPVYNGAETLEGMVQSVLAQTHKSWELLLLDDGSADATATLAAALAAEDARVQFIHLPHRGVSAARNFGLSRAVGEYVAFVDADDWLPPEYLQTLLSALGGCDMVLCDLVRVENGRETGRFTHPAGILSGREALDRLLERKYISTGPCAKLFRKALLTGLEFEPMEAYEDIVFIAQVLRRAGTVAVTDRTAYHYLQNPSGTMARFARRPSPDGILAARRLLAGDMGDGAFYATVSHLMQLCRAAYDRSFRRSTRRVYRRHLGRILTCPAFGAKERLYYLLFTLGIDI